MKPSTLQEAISIIQATFPAAELSAWAALPENIASFQAHFELGLWIRNQWFYGDGSPLTTELKKANFFLDADDISDIVVKALWGVLNGKPCPTVSELFPNATTLEPDE